MLTRGPLLSLLLAALSASAVAGAGCEAPFKTLSSDCRGTAADGKTVCLVIDQSGGGQNSPCKAGTVSNLKACAAQSGLKCDVISYKIDYQSTKARFRIKLQDGNWVASAEDTPPAAPASTPTPTTPAPTKKAGGKEIPTRVDFDDDTPAPTQAPSPGVSVGGPNAPLETNEFVDAIGQLKLDPALTEVRIVGGSSEFGTRGLTAKLQVDPHMLSQSPQVTALWIANCNIGGQLATGSLLSGMPSGLTELNLRNTLLRGEPSDLSVLQNLRSLRMEQNYLASLSSKVSLRKLTLLDLTENALTSFEAYLPAMESLYLNKNKLDAIPSVVYSMSKLQELQLAGNPISAIVVSTTQFDFLNKRRLMLDEPKQPPSQPVVYVPGPLKTPLPDDVTNLVLSSKNADLSSAVAVPVGKLEELQGVPVWKVPDAIFEVFLAQQDAIAKSSLIIGGKPVQSYKETTSTGAASAAGSSAGEDSALYGSAGDGAAPSGSSSRGFAGSTAAGGERSFAGASAKNGTANAAQSPPTLESEITNAAGDKDHKTLTVPFALTVVGVLAAVVAGLIFVRQRRRSNNEDEDSALQTPGQLSSLESCQVAAFAPSESPTSSVESFRGPGEDVRDLFSSRRLRTSDLEDVRPIGTGTSGVVWLVNWRKTRQLASKRLIQSASTTQRMAKFVNEVVIAADLDYPHIAKLVGVSWTNETDLQALFEYMPNGDLETYLRNTSPTSFTWSTTKLQMAIDIVEALVYTHSFNPPLLHRDLRTRNVLLDSEHKPKLSNFGSARFASEQNTMTTDGVGSARWLSPEVLSGRTDYDQTSDMYAFGVLLCELDTHAAPYADASGPAETALMELVARGELRPSLSPSCPETIQVLVGECLSQDPTCRPTAMRAAYELRGLKRAWEQQLALGHHDQGVL